MWINHFKSIGSAGNDHLWCSIKWKHLKANRWCSFVHSWINMLQDDKTCIMIRRVESATIVCHIAKNEPPFPVMMEMVVYAIAISKSLVDFHSWHGLSPGYQRIKWIRCLNSHHICDIYSELDHVCPPSLQDSVFTLVTIDNVYHVLLSATTKQPLHGTTISDEQNSKNIRKPTLILNSKTNMTETVTLPESYTVVKILIPSRKEVSVDKKVPSRNLVQNIFGL